jgi:DNA-binding transcriptional regulator YdaS (Cro superfamily)
MSNELTPVEIISLLGGPTSVARMLNIKPPSVSDWLDGGIPEGRLIELGAEIERRSNGRFSRRERWPDRYHLIWPELAGARAANCQVSEVH